MDENTAGIKLMLIGEQAVGKSSVLMRYCDNDFNLNMIGTAGVEFRKKDVKIDDQTIKVTIFDTAGQQRFRSITKHFYQGCKGIMLLFDASDKVTFENLKEWLKTIKDNAEEGVEVVLVANKIDLPRQVSTEEEKKFSDEVKIPIVDTSAKTGLNVEKAFETLIRNIVKKQNKPKEGEKKEEQKIEIKPQEPEKKEKASGCCSG
jgi:Ras-related protein Rab-1A